MCGEKIMMNILEKLDERITPAYAGKSRCRAGRAARGKGSPPRMRGKGSFMASVELKFRITPAYAGKRHYDHKPSMKPRDHPRVCGEKLSCCAS